MAVASLELVKKFASSEERIRMSEQDKVFFLFFYFDNRSFDNPVSCYRKLEFRKFRVLSERRMSRDFNAVQIEMYYLNV